MPNHSRWAGWSGAGLLVATAVGVAVWELLSALRFGDATLLEDLHIYRGAVLSADTGASLYDYMGVGPFNYPPFAAVLLRPLAWLPAEVGDGLWTLGTLLFAVAMCVIVVRRIRRSRTTWVGLAPTGARILGLVALSSIVMLSSTPIVVNLWLGQISGALTLLVLLDAGGVVPKRMQGCLTGIAAALKLTPLIFIPYFLITRQWRQAALCTGSFLAATGIGFLLYPQDSVVYWTNKVFEMSRVGELAVPRNSSLLGLLTRLDESSQRVIWLVLCIALVGMALLWSARHFARGQLVPAAVVMGCASIVVSPFSWPHHLVWVVLAGLWLLLLRRPALAIMGAAILLVNNVIWPLPLPLGLPAPVVWILGELPALCAVGICLLGLSRRTEDPVISAIQPAPEPGLAPTSGVSP